MESYLLKILEKNSRVIIPEFGAFIVKHQDPLVIVFNEFLQYNDGLLIDAITREEGTSRENAKIKIDAFILELNKSLNSGKPFSLGEMGVLVKSSSGKISFEDSSHFSKSIIDEGEISLDTTIDDNQESEKTEHLTKIESENKEIPAFDVSHPKKPIEKPTVEVEKKPEPIAHKVVKAEEKVTLPTNSNSKKAYQEEYSIMAKKTRRRNIIVWAAIIIIVDGAIVAYFMKGDDWQNFIKNRKATIENTVMPEPETVENITESITPVEENLPGTTSEIIEDEVVQTITEKVQEQSNTTSKVQYYIIAGAFRDVQNADKLVSELKNKGYNAEKTEKVDNLYYVCYARFSAKEEADKLLLKIKKEYDPAAWIKALN